MKTRAPRRAERAGPLLARPTTRSIIAAEKALGAAGLRYFERAIVEAARRREVTYTREGGRTIVIRLLSTPAFIDRADAVYLRRVCALLGGAFRKTVAARRKDPEVRALLPVVDGEEEWLELAPLGAAPLAARWDMNIDPARGGAAAATLFEVNGCAVGGIHYATMSSEILREALLPLPGRRPPIALPDSFRSLWHLLLDEQGRRHGRVAPRLAWLEDRTWESGITEGPSLAAHLDARGLHAAVCDPRDLELRRGEIVFAGTPRDVLYRSIEIRDLVAMESREGKLKALREAFRRGRVVSPAEGDLDHKSLLEVWSSGRFARLFSADERAIFRRHVPWTRLLGARRTDAPDGRAIDLPEFARRTRRRLVIKPNRSCGGHGVLIGPETSAQVWGRAIARALDGREPAVVQALVDSAQIEAPVSRRGQVTMERHYTTYGLFATPAGLGFLGRAAPFPVVNVSRGGGLLGVLLI